MQIYFFRKFRKKISIKNYFWEKEEVLEKLDTKMTSAFQAVYNLSVTEGLFMRDAAYVIAINRVVEAVKRRGWV